MDKLSRKPGTKYTHELMIDKLDAIIDWINASDERCINSLCLRCLKPCNIYLPQAMEPECGSFIPRDPPSIEQELESGLEHIGSYWHWHTKDKRRPVKRIFLPAAKYEEWRSQWDNTAFHNIPVFSVPGLDKIVYCTD